MPVRLASRSRQHGNQCGQARIDHCVPSWQIEQAVVSQLSALEPSKSVPTELVEAIRQSWTGKNDWSKAKSLQQIVERVVYNARHGKLAITVRPDAIERLRNTAALNCRNDRRGFQKLNT
jgi:hypothetical protein